MVNSSSSEASAGSALGFEVIFADSSDNIVIVTCRSSHAQGAVSVGVWKGSDLLYWIATGSMDLLEGAES